MACVGCGGGERTAVVCRRCRRRLAPPPVGPIQGLDSTLALFAYEEAGAALVQALKFRDGRRLVGPLATALARRLGSLDGITLTWAPTSARHRRNRGFDQAELLARAVGRRTGATTVPVLTRLPSPAQTARSADQRLSDPPRFRARRTVSGPVVLVDDVCTTGATLAAAARALRVAGAAEVHALVVARTA